jgi:long-chain acyl-CoA synthetase
MIRNSEIADSFAAVVRDRGDAPLLLATTEHRICSARHLDAAARALSQAFDRVGLAPGHLIIASTGNVAAFPALFLAALRSGLPMMPVDRSTPAAELAALATRWDAAAIVVAGTVPPVDLADEPTLTWHALSQDLAAYVRTPQPEPGRHGTAVVLKLTSGSTGAPRATHTDERHLIADVRHIVQGMAIGRDDRQLGLIPLSHSYGFSNLLLPLLWQGTPLLLRPQFVPTQVGPDIAAASLTTFAGVPFMFEHLAAHQALPRLESLRLVVSAGARLAYETVVAFHAVSGLKVRSFYGSSETGGICFDDGPELDPRVPVGRPLGDTQVTLVDDQEAPPGSGRVQVRGPNVVDGYAVPAAPAAEAEADDARDGGTLSAGTFLTGDYARLDGDGRYVLTGRVASFVNVAGRKVHPGEVEAALRSLPGVRDAVALGIADPVRGQALGAVLLSDASWDARRVREALSSRLAPYKLPRAVIVMPALPLTDRGKVDRPALLRLLERRH